MQSSSIHAPLYDDQENMTMRFISMIRIIESTGQVPSKQFMSDMTTFAEEIVENYTCSADSRQVSYTTD